MPRRIQDAILWTYQVKSIKYSLATARFVGILSLSSALYVDKGGVLMLFCLPRPGGGMYITDGDDWVIGSYPLGCDSREFCSIRSQLSC